MKDVVVYQTVTIFEIPKEGKLTSVEIQGKKTPKQLKEKYEVFYNLCYGKRQWVMSSEEFKKRAFKQFLINERTKY